MIELYSLLPMVIGRAVGWHLNLMNTYFERYAYPDQLFSDKPYKSLKISIVIPCFKEPDIITTLESLNECDPVDGVEVLLIINEAENCNPETRKQNQQTLAELSRWQEEEKLNFNLLSHYLIAPSRDAGVGFARKVGMDEAARRFEAIGKPEGTICCFDADTTCQSNYLTVIDKYFIQNTATVFGGVVHYEHPLPINSTQRAGIILYELHLRYYENALARIKYPYSSQTVGSTMIVRSDIYQKVGGMNKKKAGEDFYFLHRVMPLGNFLNISETTVYPSPRISDRVPFGTGRAMHKWKEENSNTFNTYAFKSFADLGEFFSNIDSFYKASNVDYQRLLDKLPETVRTFLVSTYFAKELVRLQKNSRDSSSFTKNWYTFFDGFNVLKFIHYARDNYYQNQPVVSESAKLARLIWPQDAIEYNQTEALLNLYRNKAKNR